MAPTEQHPLSDVAAATEAYVKSPTDSRLAAIAVASAPWNFGPPTVDAGRDLLARNVARLSIGGWSWLCRSPAATTLAVLVSTGFPGCIGLAGAQLDGNKRGSSPAS